VIGAGVVGLSVAWLLSQHGHRVQLIDPALAHGQSSEAGSSAALGLLMAEIFRRSSGRGWRLRQQSLALWRQWREQLTERGHQIPWRPGLLQLASNEQEWQAQARLAEQRQRQGLPLRLLNRAELQALSPALPADAAGALLSPNDAQIDPQPAMQALLQDGLRHGLISQSAAVLQLERGNPDADGRWIIHTEAGSCSSRWLVIAAGLASPALLEPLGHSRPQSPVLGQALELQLPAGCNAERWPGSVSWDGINLVPRPGGRLWLGATVEPGLSHGSPEALAELRQLGGAAPDWLRQAEPLRHWQGLRARPDERPAPLLELLEPGLLLTSGHYRNGVLLAPASAAWVLEQLQSPGPLPAL
jgi:glycine/D-amino acid oxidase-like deaminating enzyme